MNTLAPDWRTRPGLIATCVLVFIASTWVTILWCGAMCDMPGMGTWDLMGDQSRLGHFLAFEGMWSVMMVAMMMPVFAPALLRFRGRSAVSFAGAYFAVWALPGVIVYPLGVGISSVAAQSPAWDWWITLAGGALVLLCGWLQFTSVKRRQIECCRAAYRLRPAVPASAEAAWRQGWDTGVNCVVCCAGLTATLLVVGVMDLLAMAAVTVAVAAERLLPADTLMARKVGWILLAMGVFLLARALTGG
jgi:predicted metal-binding membrane protein